MKSFVKRVRIDYEGEAFAHRWFCVSLYIGNYYMPSDQIVYTTTLN